jgi:hypothetical protein
LPEEVILSEINLGIGTRNRTLRIGIPVSTGTWYSSSTWPSSEQDTGRSEISLKSGPRRKTAPLTTPLHRTIPILTKYEKARIIGVRATHQG